jgi:aminopeptidase-like protein
MLDGTRTAGSGEHLFAFVERLYPLARSITGEGVRATLAMIGEHTDLHVHEVPSGTPALDWTVPREWNVRDAFIARDGERIVDLRSSNLHVLSYSTPVDARMPLEELRGHLHTLPDHPDWIPYRTSYYREQWGFCIRHRELESLTEGEYDVCIDATLADGSLSYGEVVLPGETAEEVLVSTHTCHPSLANDNCSGIAVATWLAATLAGVDHRYTYRFVFAPGTIGSIVWLSRNEERVGLVRHGLVLSNLGDRGDFTYKRSRRGDADVDRAAATVLRQHPGSTLHDFTPYGYDERQYCSPGFDLPVGSLSRTSWGQYREYHTSADDLSFVTPDALEGSLRVCLELFDALERDDRYVNTSPKGEPQLGRRGLYSALGGAPHDRDRELALLWVLNLSDGEHSLLDIADRSGLGFARVADAAEQLLVHDLLVPCPAGS